MIKIYCPKCGAWNDNAIPLAFGSYINSCCKDCLHNFKIELIQPLTIDLIISMVKAEKKIHAIKRVRDEMKWGLREAKEYVDLVSAIHYNHTYRLEIDYPIVYK